METVSLQASVRVDFQFAVALLLSFHHEGGRSDWASLRGEQTQLLVGDGEGSGILSWTKDSFQDDAALVLRFRRIISRL